MIFHRSEWSYGFPDVEGKIRNEIKDYFVSIVNPNLSTPIDEDVLEQKIDFYIRKIKNLGFWDQIRVDTSPREGEEDLEAFPQSPHVFHFHPYALIVQMNRIESKNKSFSIEKAVNKLNSIIKPASKGACAMHVRIAIEAGGLSTIGRPESAKDYNVFLRKIGFSVINEAEYIPIKGDIVVIQNIVGHIHGHIAMYNGEYWISDFRQRDFWGGEAYRSNKPKHTFFRWE